MKDSTAIHIQNHLKPVVKCVVVSGRYVEVICLEEVKPFLTALSTLIDHECHSSPLEEWTLIYGLEPSGGLQSLTC